MHWHMVVWNWLAESALLGLLLSAVGVVAVCICREPVRRLRLIQLTLAACLVAPCLRQIPVWPHWSLGWTEAAALSDGPTGGPAIAVLRGDADALQSGGNELPHDAEEPVARNDAVGQNPTRAAAPSAGTAAVEDAAHDRLRSPLSTAAPRLIVTTYFVALGLFVLWWGAALVRLWRICRTTQPAPAWVVEQMHRIGGAGAEEVRVVVSNAIAVPITTGWRRPITVLPRGLCAPGEEESLRYCLAHEWSHVERRDLRAWHLATLVQLVFFYQPFVWWLRRQLRLCQDYLADARAAAQSEIAADYAEMLVRLARRRVPAAPTAALGFADRRSHLYRRIAMLLKNANPLEQACRRRWSVMVTSLAIVAVGAASIVRLEAEEKPAALTAPDKQEPEAQKPAEPQAGESFTYTGRVTDAVSGEAIAGATVTVRRGLLGDPRYLGLEVLEETKHATDREGKYTFTIPPEQAEQRYLYIELDVYAPEHAARTGFGYAFSMIRKNEGLGGEPFFEHVELYPGKAITGTVETPEGKPAAGVRVLAYSKHAQQQQRTIGSFAHGETDENGRFRLVIATPGDGVFWIHPKDYMSTVQIAPKDRGDLGRFVLQQGMRLSGRVLDAKGNPVPSVWVNASREGNPNDEIVQLLSQLNVGDSIGRAALSDEAGNFEMLPLPPGEYRVAVEEYCSDPYLRDRRRFPVEPVFMPFTVALSAGEEPQPLEVRAVPHVEIRAQHLDSKGNPSRGHEVFLFGRMDGEFFHTRSGRPADGRIVIKAPHGLEQAQLDLMTNEHGVLRYRLSKDGELHNGRRIELGTLEADVEGIEIVRYTAPILLVKAVDQEGKLLEKYQVTAEYADKEGVLRFVVTDGLFSNVNFEKQQDGRFRSSQLRPDEEVTVTVHAQGYKSAPQIAKLAEGAEKELVFAVEKE